MDNLVSQKTKTTPGINFDANTQKWEITGSSYPENASEFYKPVFDWMAQYMMEEKRAIYLDFKIDYLNSSSIKFISDLIDRLNKYSLSGKTVEVNWFHKDDDEDIKELGEEFKEEVSYNFNIIEI
ncbi:MAG: DUF1987 domain-containing protein [Ignavibacteriales bacterium]|nr:DUF1987 domain-containing protein [Ignavibacteriales bacterium]